MIVSSVRVVHGPAHDIVRVWSRGGFAGELTVNAGDGGRIAHILVGEDSAVTTTAQGDTIHRPLTEPEMRGEDP